MSEEQRKTPLVFYRSAGGGEPVREWLIGLDPTDRRQGGHDLMRAQWRWPIGMPLCRALGNGLWEVRSDLQGNRTARVLFCSFDGAIVALHAFVKKSRTAPVNELTIARKRMKEVMS